MTAAVVTRARLAHDIEIAAQHLREDPHPTARQAQHYADLLRRWDGIDWLTTHVRPVLVDRDGDMWWWAGSGYRRPGGVVRSRTYVDRWYGPVRITHDHQTSRQESTR